MRTEKLQLSDVRYNPETSAFEAIVRIHDGRESYDYPTHFCAPLQADFRHVSRGLVERAKRAHASGTADLRLRRTTVPVQTVNRPAPQRQTSPLMVRMLRALAA